MSTDEIRSQKALALLEFKEAEEDVARLIKEMERLGAAFHAVGSILQDAGNITEVEQSQYTHITITAAYETTCKLLEARKQLIEATTKKKQFGL